MSKIPKAKKAFFQEYPTCRCDADKCLLVGSNFFLLDYEWAGTHWSVLKKLCSHHAKNYPDSTRVTREEAQVYMIQES